MSTSKQRKSMANARHMAAPGLKRFEAKDPPKKQPKVMLPTPQVNMNKGLQGK